MISGAITGSITAILFQPLEFIKTQLQQPNNQNVSLLNLTRQNLRTKSFFVLWNGLTPSIIRTVPGVSVYFGAIEYLKHASFFKTDSDKMKMLNSFLIGVTSRTIADVTMFPLSLIKTRYESNLYSYCNMLDAFKSILRNEGLSGLYRGFNATLIRDTQYSGLYFMIYTKIKMIYGENVKEHESIEIASYALASGILCSLVTQPFDVCRTYMQLDPKKYKSLSNTFHLIYSQKGLNGLFIGLIPRSFRRILISVLGWTVFERFTK
jgi:solute carrier family 25, member 38